MDETVPWLLLPDAVIELVADAAGLEVTLGAELGLEAADDALLEADAEEVWLDTLMAELELDGETVGLLLDAGDD